MQLFSNKRWLVAISFVFIFMIISACSNDTKDTDDSSKSNDEAKTADVTLKGKKGEVTIPGDVERIIAPYHEDALLALGVTPVAKWSIGKSVQNYLEPQLKDVPRLEWNLPQEQVLESDPELIVLGSDLASYEGSYEDYKKIATTYVLPDDADKDWRKQIKVFGKMLQKEDKADDVLAAYDEKVAKAKKTLNDSIGDESVAMIWVTGNQFYLFEKNRHSAEVVYSDLGIKVPPFVDSLGDAKSAWNPLSMEKLSELKADHVFLLGLDGEQGLETLKKSDVWQSIPAAKNNHVYTLNDPSFWTNKGLLASEKTIDAMVDTLAK